MIIGIMEGVGYTSDTRRKERRIEIWNIHDDAHAGGTLTVLDSLQPGVSQNGWTETTRRQPPNRSQISIRRYKIQSCLLGCMFVRRMEPKMLGTINVAVYV
jgi:hypothetical protein